MTHLHRSLEQIAQQARPSVVTVGNFDGVHRGHQMVLAEIQERARALGARSVAVTFDPHPTQVLKPGRDLRLITPVAEKVRLLQASGIDDVLLLPFSEELAALSPDSFAQQILAEALHAVEVHEGENFRFGCRAAGDIAALRSLGTRFGFGVVSHPPLCLRGAAVSSSRVRHLVAMGNVSLARTLLRRSFSVHSTPAPGRGYGTRYAVPTINLAPYAGLVPAHGVYITLLRVGERTFRGVTNAGNRPTFGADSYAIESHLLDFEPVDLAEDTPLELTFLKRLRGEQRFPSPEALKQQIGADVRRAQRYFALCNALS